MGKEQKDVKQSSLEQIWSDIFWFEQAEAIELQYADLLNSHGVPKIPCPELPERTEHRIESFVRSVSHLNNRGEMHTGLTSSDLEENVRIYRLEMSWMVLNNLLNNFWSRFSEWYISNDINLKAYTHLMEAGEIGLMQRFRVLKNTYGMIIRPYIMYRGIHGSLGTRHVQKALGISNEELDRLEWFRGKTIQPFASQSSNHITDLDVANWLVAQTAVLAKLANDLRQMFAKGEVYNSHKDIASTAIAQKKHPNPWRWERMSGMAEKIYHLPSIVARTLSSTLLERTLTDQSVLNDVFKDAIFTLNGLIEDATIGLSTLAINKDKEVKIYMLNPEIELAELVKKGVPRIDAYKQVNKEYGQ